MPTRDYYRIQAVFAPVQFADREARFLPDENTSRFAELEARTRKRLAASKRYLVRVRKKSEEAVAAYLHEKGVRRVDQLPPEERPRAGFFGLSPLEMSLEKMHRKWVSYFERELNRCRPYATTTPRRWPSGSPAAA